MVCLAEYQFYQQPIFCLNSVLLKKDRFLLKILVRVDGYWYVSVMGIRTSWHWWKPKRTISLCSKKSKAFNFFCSLLSIFFVRLMRTGKLRFWHKSQPFHLLNLEVLQRKSNIPLAFSHLVWENCQWKSAFTCNFSVQLVPLKITFNWAHSVAADPVYCFTS